MDLAAAYRRSYDRVCELVDEQVADLRVPTCPGWTVKDVIAHLASFFSAYRLGDPKAAFSPGWGDREVEARQNHSLHECLTEWSKAVEDPGDVFESRLGLVAVADVLAHEQDIRTALNQPGAADEEAIVPAVEMGLSFLGQKPEAQELPAVRFVTDEIDQTVGTGSPGVTLRTSTFELFRTLHGRRTVEQVRAMNWEGDPGPWLPTLFLFGPIDHEVAPRKLEPAHRPATGAAEEPGSKAGKTR